MGSAASAAISTRFDGEQPFVAGKQITGTVTFNNTSGKSLKFQRIYAQVIGKVVFTIRDRNGSTTLHMPFFKQLFNVEEKEETFALESGYHSWPMCLSLPAFLPPSLDQIVVDGPYIAYKIRIVFVRPKKFSRNIHQDFRILIIAAPSSNLELSYVTIEAEKKNSSNVTVRVALIDQKESFVPGDSLLLNIELHNPNHKIINGLSIDLVQDRKIGIGAQCMWTFSLLDLAHLQKFSGENYCDTLELVIPDDNRIIPSFSYTPPGFEGHPIIVEYMLKLKVKTHGFSKDIILNLPIRVHSIEMYMPSSNEDEESPSPYDVAIAKH